MTMREYKLITKGELADAYGFRKEETIVFHIKRQLEYKKLDKKKLNQLGKWEGRPALLPGQVQILVEEVLGPALKPEKLYIQKRG